MKKIVIKGKLRKPTKNPFNTTVSPRYYRHKYQILADKLNSNTPKSEEWFYNLCRQHRFPRLFNKNNLTEQFLNLGDANIPFNKYIPDIVNKTYKFIIEIDGSFHEQDWVKKKDAEKDKFFTNAGYLVIRIKDHNIQSFIDGMTKLALHCAKIDSLWGKRPEKAEKFHQYIKSLKAISNGTSPSLAGDGGSYNRQVPDK